METRHGHMGYLQHHLQGSTAFYTTRSEISIEGRPVDFAEQMPPRFKLVSMDQNFVVEGIGVEWTTHLYFSAKCSCR